MGIACRGLGVVAVGALVWMGGLAVAAAQPETPAQDCFPACRSGYVCHQGQCVSACNPPCQAGEQCTGAGQCVAAGPTSGTSAPPPGPPAAAPAAAPPGAQGGGGWVSTTGTFAAPQPDRTADHSLRFGIGAMLGFEASWDLGMNECAYGVDNDGAPNLGFEGSMRMRLARFASIRVGAFATFSLGFDNYCEYASTFAGANFSGSAISFGAEAVFRLGPLGPWFFGAGPSLGAHLVSGDVTGPGIDFSTSSENFMFGFATETGFVFGGNENIELGARLRAGFLTDDEGGRVSGSMFFGYFF